MYHLPPPRPPATTSAARVHPSLACAFVKSTLQSVLGASDAERLEGVQWSHVEVALWLLYLLGEGLPEAATREIASPTPTVPHPSPPPPTVPEP